MPISNQEENKNLGYLGDDFQYKLCKYLIEQPDFYNSIKTTLNPNAFTVPIIKTIVGVLNDYSDNYNSVADYTTLKMLMNSKFQKQEDKTILSNELNKLQTEVSIVSDKDWVRQQAFNFFKQQELVKAINKAREILANGEFDNYDAIKGIIEKAMNSVHASEDMGRKPIENIDEIMDGNTRHPIPTGIKQIDERTNGGLGKGELGLICGASGFGKVQPYDAMVCAPKGMVPMREIVVGSEVIGADGKPHKVIAVFPHKDWDFYKVTFNDGVSTECGMEHLWKISLNKKEWRVCELKEIKCMQKFISKNKENWKINIPICKKYEPNVDERYFTDIQFSRKADGQCILVDGEDHTYLTDNYIVTHNTSISTALTSYASTCPRPNGLTGYKVLYIFFEDTYLQIQRKFMGRELNVEACMLRKYYESVGRSREDMAYLESRFKALNENVWLKKMRDGEKSASEIEDMIQHNYIERGFHPDLVIIDYFECLAPEKGTMNMKQHERELFTMRRIEAMCSNLECAIWVATQATKDSYNSDIITADKISGSTSKFNVSHICMTIMKSDEDRANNTASIAFLKNRAGSCGAVLTNVGFNNGTCRINTENSEVMGFEEYRQREEERQVRMRQYIGSLTYTANQITEDIPKSNDLTFFGGSGDDAIPF